MLLGYQKNCCDCPPETALPDDVEVTFSSLPSQIAGPDLCTVTLSSCYGSGASVRIAGPIGKAGPISAVEVVDGGGGYAVLGREQPTLDIKASFGSGATFTPTLASKKGDCDLPYWSIESVSVTGGAGYIAGQSLSVAAKAGDTESVAAALSLRTKIPTVTATVPGGSGASLSVTLATPAGKVPGAVPYVVQSVSVNNGGSGYKNGTAVTFSAPGARLASSAAAHVQTEKGVSGELPFGGAGGFSPLTVGADLNNNPVAGGAGAVLVATVAQTVWQPTENVAFPEAGTYLTVQGLAVAAAGAGYVANELLAFYASLPNGLENATPDYKYLLVTAVDQDGGIVSATTSDNSIIPDGFNFGGYYFFDTGPIQSVVVTDGGQYDSGAPSSVDVANGGKYYRESDKLSPHVADVTISISQADPSSGTGAKLKAVVGDDPLDTATFGTITGVTIEDGGDNYMAAEWVDFAGKLYEGLTFRIPRTECACCRFDGCDSHGHKTELLEWPAEQYKSATVSVAWGGQSGPHRVSLSADYRDYVAGKDGLNPYTDSTLTIDFLSGTEDAPYACEPLSFDAEGVTVGAESAIATVAAASSPLPCADIFGATTIKATIESSDYFRQVKRQFETSSGSKYWRYDTQYFRGNELAGEIELSPRGKLNLADSVGGSLRWYYLWSYQYENGSCIKTARTGLSAGYDEVWFLMRDDYGVIAGGAFVGLLGTHTQSVSPGPDDSVLKAQGWFECLEHAAQMPPQSLGPASVNREAGCGCRLENLTTDRTVGDYVPPLPVSSDAAGPHTLLSSTTVTESGSLADAVTITFSLP